jgi:signal transduction histidine kinase
MSERNPLLDSSFVRNEPPLENAMGRHSSIRIGPDLFDLYDRMIGAVHIPTVLGEVAQVVSETLHADRASVFLIDRETHELESVAVIGNVARAIRVPIDHNSLAGYCAKTGEAFIVDDAYDDLSPINPDLAFDRRWDDLNHFHTHDVICAPAVFKGEVMGVVQAINHQDGPFRSGHLASLETIARLIGYALYHAKLYNDLATLKKLEQEKAQFMRLMAHELKSPLTTSKMLLDLLDGGKAVQHTEMVATRLGTRLDEMLDMITDLLSLAKVKCGVPMGEVEILDLVAATLDACDRCRQETELKGLDFMVDLPKAPAFVRFDAQGIRLVLSNLLSNAVKYTPEGSIGVALTTHDGWVQLAVRDSGIGIPEADIPKLFAEFFRASNAKRRKMPGSGVGLAGVKQVIERFGGHIELTSQEDVGTTFTVHLPLHPTA